MGKIQSAAARATVSTGALASKIGNTVFKIMGEATESNSSVNQDNTEQIEKERNADIQKQIEANRIAIEKVTAEMKQKDDFTKLLAIKKSGMLGGVE